MQRNQHSPEFIEQALGKARERGSRTLQSVAAELNMSLGTLKGWLKRSGPQGAELPHAPTLPGDERAGRWTPVQRTRLHSTLAYVSPMKFEQDWLAARPKQAISRLGYGIRIPGARSVASFMAILN